MVSDLAVQCIELNRTPDDRVALPTTSASSHYCCQSLTTQRYILVTLPVEYVSDRQHDFHGCRRCTHRRRNGNCFASRTLGRSSRWRRSTTSHTEGKSLHCREVTCRPRLHRRLLFCFLSGWLWSLLLSSVPISRWSACCRRRRPIPKGPENRK